MVAVQLRLTARQATAVVLAFASGATAPLFNPASAAADNSRLNNGVLSDVYTAQKKNGCQSEPRRNRFLVEAARLHTLDLMSNRELNGDVGSDGSSAQDRAKAAGFVGVADETVAINASFAISGLEILNQWWWDPRSRAIMQDCRNTAVGVWSENSLDRTVVVAVYGQPAS